jgi:hypothetical protein
MATQTYSTNYPKIMRLFTIIIVAALLAVFTPKAGFAASVPTLSITEVKAGVSVTVHGTNFPSNVDFTARMDVLGNYAIGGTVVGSFNSSSGTFDATFNIPASLKNERTVGIRVDGTGGWYSYNAFTNNTSSVVVNNPPATGTTLKNFIEVIGVKANETITVQARNFPANQTFKIRIGTFKNFSKDFVVVGSVNSGTGGSFTFNVTLPSMQKDVELFTIRLDSPEKNYAYNIFKNITSGTTTPGASPTPAPVTGICQVQNTSPIRNLAVREDFDAIWTVKNTSNKNWELSAVDYKFISGSKIHTGADMFDLPVTVKPGESINIIVDMLAPATAATYAANWALVQGGTTLCTLPLTVIVR